MKVARFLLVLIGVPLLHGEPFPQFTLTVIDRIGNKLGQTALVDVDRDGDLDYICGEADHGGSRVWWWEFQGSNSWRRHEIGKGHTDVGGAAHDVNGDAWVDFLAGSVLLLNSGQPRSEAFKKINVGTLYSHDTVFADVDGDGQADVIANSDKSGLFWYSVPIDPEDDWKRHEIALRRHHQIHGGISPKGFGDVDGDGDLDVITGQAWYENTDGRGLHWQAHHNLYFGSHHRYGLAVKTWVGDLDGDGDVDVIQSEADHPDGRVAWFENDGNGNWERHIIKEAGDHQDFHSLAVADFDNDGDLDVFSGGGPLTKGRAFQCFIWEQRRETSDGDLILTWKEHLVAEKHCHEAVAGDVDRDGDVDIVFKPWSVEKEHIFLENSLVSGD